MDIVYVLHNYIATNQEELRYSVRSLVNYDYNRLWFAGGLPEGIVPDGAIHHQQIGNSKWEKVRSTLLKVCSCPDISEDFILFNDDFFIMRPQGYQTYVLEKDLEEHGKGILRRRGNHSRYAKNLVRLSKDLRAEGYPILSYAVHAPMAFNRQKLAAVLKKYPAMPMYRALYGNVYQVPATPTHDFKVHTLEGTPNWPIVSTTEGVFKDGAIGRIIRETFTEKSRYEL